MIPLLVIRHAPTDWNEAGLMQGRTDRPLSDAGRDELRRMQLPEGWNAAFCLASPLRRATETAELLGLKPILEPRLIEMDWGAWEGRSLAELRAALGRDMAENEARGLDFRPAAGESPRDVQDRLRPLLKRLSRPTVAITHKGVLRALYALATGWPMTEKPPQWLLDGHAHLFALEPNGSPKVEQLNIPLEAPP